MDTKKTITLADWKPTKKQIKNVNQVLKSGRLTYGPFTKELEKKFAKLHNFKYCIFTNSGTSALHIALQYLKKRYQWDDGDEVIVPAVTFVATVNVVLQNNLKPVLVDIDRKTLNIDPHLIERKLTNRTRAIMPVDLLGRPHDIAKVKQIAKKLGLKIVEDSCETMFVNHPSGEVVGSLANLACYSSYLAHIISTGVGGFLCTNSKIEEEYLRGMIWHGRDKMYYYIEQNQNISEKLLRARFRFDKPGHSYRLTEMEAAIGVDELDRADEIIKKRKQNAAILHRLLSPFEGRISLPDIKADNAWMFFPIICNYGVERNKLCLFLEKKGIQTRTIMPLTNQPIFSGMWNRYDYTVANTINRDGFLIGVHHFLKEADLKYVAKCFKEYFND